MKSLHAIDVIDGLSFNALPRTLLQRLWPRGRAVAAAFLRCLRQEPVQQTRSLSSKFRQPCHAAPPPRRRPAAGQLLRALGSALFDSGAGFRLKA